MHCSHLAASRLSARSYKLDPCQLPEDVRGRSMACCRAHPHAQCSRRRRQCSRQPNTAVSRLRRTSASPAQTSARRCRQRSRQPSTTISRLRCMSARPAQPLARRCPRRRCCRRSRHGGSQPVVVCAVVACTGRRDAPARGGNTGAEGARATAHGGAQRQLLQLAPQGQRIAAPLRSVGRHRRWIWAPFSAQETKLLFQVLHAGIDEVTVDPLCRQLLLRSPKLRSELSCFLHR
mmetsp:Transcript_11374/g.40350  ORF Transcript_11374/g.40350 Transcript_11374/m.40350 type:complete len:234 (+) Transcript_11374:184-885(+)